MEILREPLPLTEKLSAIYLKAYKVLDSFKVVEMPYAPAGWVESHQAYKTADKDEKSAMWKGLVEEFRGYITELDKRKADNLSNKIFLTEMMEHFKSIDLLSHAEAVRLVLNGFSEPA
jgi:hypothetical protein